MGEQEIRLVEAQAQQLAQRIRAILTDLGHDPADEQVRQVVRLRLTGGPGRRVACQNAIAPARGAAVAGWKSGFSLREGIDLDETGVLSGR
jgi:hypothetical protein